MTNITYTYQIIAVDLAARYMEIVYTSEGNPLVHISARLPYEGETLESVVQMYAPVRRWEELKLNTQTVAVGTQGSITVTGPTAFSIAYGNRNAMLANSDWTQLADVPLTAEEKADWATYRQALRDVPSQPGFPNNIVWPAAPNGAAPGSIPVST